MKKIINRAFVALAAVVLLMGCQSEGQKALSQIVGEWHYSGVEEGVQEDIWIAFSQDMTFELYQKVGEGRYRRYDGTYTVTGSVVSGSYSDKKKWGSDYDASFDGEKLVLTAKNGSAEVCTYEKKALSDTDKADAILMTKSVEDGPRFL